jgi:3-oxoadipate enol-lactonase
LQDVINGLRMNWREEGSGDVIVFLHAFPLHGGMWEPQLNALPPGWRGIAPDFRGFGRSAPAGDGPFTMDVFADDVAALLRHLNINNAVICGLSMGGYAAFSFYRKHRSFVRALALCNTRPTADAPEAKQGRLQLAAKVRAEGVRAVIDAMLPKLLSDGVRQREPDKVHLVEQMISQNPADSIARGLEGLAARANSEDLLRNIDVPVLVIHGEDDVIIPRGEAQMMARGIRGARIQILQEAGHLSNIEQTEGFNRLLSDFLVNLPPFFGNLSTKLA